jgi:hypothetical protein
MEGRGKVIAFVEIIVTLIGLLLFCAFIWSIFDHRDLRAKYNRDREETIEEFAKLQAQIDKLNQRTGI